MTALTRFNLTFRNYKYNFLILFQERIKVLQNERSQIKQKRQHLMVRRKELENSQRTISDIEKHLETSKLKLKELVAEGNQKMNEKANLKKELGTKYLVFVSSLSVKMRVSSAFSVCIFLRKVCLFFNF